MKSIFVFFIYILSYFALPAKSLNLVINSLNNTNGLPSNTVNAIVQDKQGYIWIGTTDGLCRFNGSDIKVYRFNPNDTNSLINPYILSLAIDKYDHIWIGTQGGLCIFNKKENQFTRFTSNQNLLSSNAIISIVADSHDFMWISTTLGLAYAEARLNTNTTEIFNVFKGYEASKVIELNDHQLIVKIKDYYNIRIDPVTGKIGISLILKSNMDYISSLIKLPNNSILIGSYSNGLFLYQKNRISKLDLKKLQLDNGNIVSIELIDNQKLLVLTQSGAYISPSYKPNEIVFSRIENKLFYDFDISIIVGRSSFTGTDGTIWLGTLYNGLVFFNINNQRFNNLIIPKECVNSLNNITSIIEDDNENILLATGDMKLVMYNPKDETYTDIRSLTQNKLFKGSQIFHLLEDHKNNDVLVSSIGTESTIARIQFSRNAYILKNIYKIDETFYLAHAKGKNNFWRGSWRGLYKTKLKENDQFDDVSINNYLNMDIKQTERVRVIKYHPTRNILVVGTFNGLYLFSLNSEDMPIDFKICKNDPKNKNSLSNDFIHDILITKEKKVWIATDAGLNELIFHNDTSILFRNSNNTDSIPSQKSLALVEDHIGNIWLNTHKGLVKYNPNSNTNNTFNKYDGLSNNGLNEHTQAITKSGKIAVGSYFGANILDPEKININQNEAIPLIYSLIINNTEVTINDTINDRVILQRDLIYTDSIELTRNENSFSIKFSALHFVAPQNIVFQYKLDGFDDNWISPKTNNRFATYTNLKGGSYTFLVKATNNDGIWSEKIAKLHIKIIPPIWERLWFQLVALLLLIGIINFIFIFRILKMKKSKKIIEQIVIERTKQLSDANIALNETNSLLEERQIQIIKQNELIRIKNEKLHETIETKDKLFSIVAHDLKNPIGTMSGFAELLETNYDTYDEEKKKRFTSNIFQLSVKLKSLVESILQWARSQMGSITIEKKDYFISNQVNNLIILYSEQTNLKNIEIINQIKPSISINADYNIIDTILRNLISNAIKYTSNGQISINYHADGQKPIISVTDTGIGMVHSKLESLFTFNNTSQPGTNGETGTGLGMPICKEFIQLHGGQIWAESKLDKGTKISFSI